VAKLCFVSFRVKKYDKDRVLQGSNDSGKLAALDAELRSLRQSRLRMEGAVEASGLILREWDTAADEALYCGAAESILGIFPHELLGSFEKWVMLIHPDDRADYRKAIQRVITEGGPFEIEYRIRKRGDKQTLLLERGYFINPSQGAHPVLSSTIADVTQLRDLESRVRKSQRVEAFSQLTGGVAHDFNNMLSVVIGYAQILMEEAPENADQLGFLHEIEKAALRASSLTNQLLAFTKPLATRKGTLQLTELLHELVKMLDRLLGERITLKIEPAEGIWTVQADRSQIEQLFINLAVACREAMPDGGDVLIASANEAHDKATIFGEHVLPAGSYVRVSLNLLTPSDKIHPRNLDKSRSIAAARTVIEQNEGLLFVHCAHHPPARINIYFPSASETTTPKIHEAKPIRGSKAAEILLVEDDSSMRQFAKTVLARLGHKIHEASNGEEALALFERDRTFAPDLLIADMVMPRLGGLELAYIISKKLPRAAVLLASGYPDQQAIAQKSGHSFLKKPFAVGELISRTGTLLSD
jgi:two-component system cell cycle sensor histidine kinase/response regulator CckA